MIWFGFLLLRELGSVSKRAEIPAELLLLFSLYLEDREVPSRMDRRHCKLSSSGFGSLCLQCQRT